MAVKNIQPLKSAVDLDELEKKVEAGAWNPEAFAASESLLAQARFVNKSMFSDTTDEEVVKQKEEALQTYCKSFEKYLEQNNFVLVKENLVAQNGTTVARVFVAPKEYEALENFAQNCESEPEQKRALELLDKMRDQCIARHQVLAPCVQAYQPGLYQKERINQIPESTIREIQHKDFKISELRKAHPELKSWCDEQSKRLEEKEKSLAMTVGRKAAWFSMGGIPAAGVVVGIMIPLTIVLTGGIAAGPIAAAAILAGIFAGLAAVDKANSQHKEGKENAFFAFVNRQLDRFSKKTEGDGGQKEPVVKEGVDKTPKYVAPLHTSATDTAHHTSATDIAHLLEGKHSAKEIAGAKQALLAEEQKEVKLGPVKTVSAGVTAAPEANGQKISLYDGLSKRDKKEIDDEFKKIEELSTTKGKFIFGKRKEKFTVDKEDLALDDTKMKFAALVESLEAFKSGVSQEGIDKARACLSSVDSNDDAASTARLLGDKYGSFMASAESIIDRAQKQFPAEPSHHMRPGG